MIKKNVYYTSDVIVNALQMRPTEADEIPEPAEVGKPLIQSVTSQVLHFACIALLLTALTLTSTSEVPECYPPTMQEDHR